MPSVVSLLGVLAVVILILFMAHMTTRWIASGSGGMSGMGGDSNFRVLAQIRLGRTERLILVYVRDTCFLLGVTEHTITLLKEWKVDDEELSKFEIPATPDFFKILKENLQKRR